jgi:hypothetical protein
MAEYITSLVKKTQQLAKKVRKYFGDPMIDSIQQSEQLINYSRDIETLVQNLLSNSMVIFQKTDAYTQKTQELNASADGSYNRISLSEICTQMSDDLANDQAKYRFQFQKTIKLCDEAFDVSTLLFENLTYIIVSTKKTSSESQRVPLLQESHRSIGLIIDSIKELLVNLKTTTTEPPQKFADIARTIAKRIKNIGEISSNALELLVDGSDEMFNIFDLANKTRQSMASTRDSIAQVKGTLTLAKAKTAKLDATDPDQTTFVSSYIEDLGINLRRVVKLLQINADNTRKLYNIYNKKEKTAAMLSGQLAIQVRRISGYAIKVIRDADALADEADTYSDGLMEIARRIADSNFNPDQQARRARLKFMFSSLEEKITDKITKARGSSKEKKSPKVKTSAKAKKSPKVKTSAKAKKSPKVKTSAKAKKSPKVKTSAKAKKSPKVKTSKKYM